MFSVRVRDRVMIAHSFKGDLFGPAQRLHGATFVVDVTFKSPNMSSDGVVVDIGRAHDTLKAMIGTIAYRNLDDIPEFKGQNTTTEFLSKWFWDGMAAAVRKGDLGPGGEAITVIGIEIAESDVAWAGYEAPLR